ncbi:unnamed protein product [Oncorhynchus mykiss]|uniref:GDP-fucose pyrophosphorylase domain-containing protein n=1 Tax=Oncorhynchus mykiss TaxID=8022 RepID=A0A060YKB8_ONCMY|nr:unnamed protein product [Oncorhynchus mykiss]
MLNYRAKLKVLASLVFLCVCVSELEVRQQRGGLLQGTLLLTVSDPQEPGLGSGGATLNALLVAAEHLSARAGYTVVTADVLDDAHILILHTGRDFPWDSCGRAFCWLPVEKPAQTVQGPVCCLDMLLDCLSNQKCHGRVFLGSVCWHYLVMSLTPPIMESTLLMSRVEYVTSSTRGQRSGFAEPHSLMGWCHWRVVERLLKAHVTPPLDGCTYMGMDSGAPPIQISLFLDLLMCLCSDLSESEFVNGERTGCSSPISQQGAVVRSARALLWRILRGTTLHMVYVPGGCYDYLTLSGREHIGRLTKKGTERDTLSHIQVPGGRCRF